jgi:hypothetical protein
MESTEDANLLLMLLQECAANNYTVCFFTGEAHLYHISLTAKLATLEFVGDTLGEAAQEALNHIEELRK